jgi:RNA polymerase sigma factor (sigma-70 family)
MNTLKASTDSDLIQSFLSGNQNSFEILVRRYQSQVYTASWILTRDKYVSEDILQETYIKFYQVIRDGRYEHRDKVCAYLVRLAHNLSCDYLRIKNRQPVITSVNGKEIFNFLNISEEISLDSFDRDVNKERLKWAISKLPESQREMVMLRYFAGMSFKEISEMIGVNHNTCLGRMRYAVDNLKKYLVPKRKRYAQNLYPK